MKTIKWAAMVIMIFTLVSMVPGQSFAKTQFTDVTPQDDFYEHLNYIMDKGIISGYKEDNTFRPNNNLTRAQAAKMLVIAKNKQDIPITSKVIKDIDPKKYAEQYDYASRAVILGYFKVGADGKFNPNEKLKRDEMGNALAVAFNLSEKVSVEKPMMFQDMISHPNADRINGLFYAGVTQGDDKMFLPFNHLTRKHFTLFLARAMNPDLSLPVKPPEQTSRTYFAKVVTSGETLNVRSLPSVDGDIIQRLNNNDIVEVVGQTGDWLLILLEDGEGYINGRYTVEAGTETPDEPTVPEEPTVTGNLIGKVTVKSLNMRQTASTDSPVIAALTLGQKVEVLSLDGNWAKIHVNSKTGFVSKTYLKLLNQTGNPLTNRIIVLDPGHGAHDPGASKNKVTEKAITLKVGNLVEAKLKKAGAKVVMTRSNDTYLSLEQRTEFAKKNFAETFVSIHVNSAASTTAKGSETYFDSSLNANSAESKSLATYIQNNLVKKANMVNRGVKDNRFYVIRNNNVAAVLVELAFISNADDFNKLTSDAYLEIYAESIYQGLVQYYSAQ